MPVSRNARYGRQKLKLRWSVARRNGSWIRSGWFPPAEQLSQCSAAPPRYKYRHRAPATMKKKEGIRKEPVLDQERDTRKKDVRSSRDVADKSSSFFLSVPTAFCG